AGFALGFEVIAHRLEQHSVRVGALGGEAARRAGAGIEGIAIALIGRERRQLHDGPAMQRRLPFVAVEIELVGPDRAIDRRTRASSSKTSLTGRNAASSSFPVDRCVSGSKLRTDSSVSPKKSRRSGSAAPAG